MKQPELKETRRRGRAVICTQVRLSPRLLILLSRQLPSLLSATFLWAVRSQQGWLWAALVWKGHATTGPGRCHFPVHQLWPPSVEAGAGGKEWNQKGS